MSQDVPSGLSSPNSQQVLFLDFDGVLHAVGEAVLDDDGRLIPNRQLFCWRSFLELALAPYPHVKIIISSDWRRLFDDDNLRRLLGPTLGPRVIGAVSTSRPTRAEEILTEAARRNISNWLTLDDHPSVVRARRQGNARFIACSPNTGLSNARVLRELQQKLSDLETSSATADTSS